MSELRIFEMAHWQATHRRDARFPGYLILSAKERAADLPALSMAALQELGAALARAETILQRAYEPYKVVFYKLGFTSGLNCHFHVAPITQSLLDEIIADPGYANEPDGNDAILFLSRVYCERPLTAQEREGMQATVQRLRAIADIESAA
ncbi:hypothetical protein [Chromobacterium sp. IIBBL 290-4]|uniref:hypothetical protein n=1 Tax=Chromobacterium sp. IIBBL 290-4 TaxID=2953890 RepID=UPI0020B8BC57|nr:hypothetical protein [Chromobacterium sp. IIBBL 290-4]UTH76195.1 hypothetical protein NKT35_08875 [Chromobacterium sp. IIBBL 290-4]